MSAGGTRRSQSATFFNVSRKQGETLEQPNSKRKREDTNPTVLVDQTSTSTLIDTTETTQMASLLSPNTDVYRNINKVQAALKLNRLKEKAARYESHKDFLSRCVAEKLVPKGLKLELEPTLGNHDQEFLDNWFSKLNEFSLILMDHIVSYCGKTLEKTNNDISATETALKNAMEQEEFTRIQRAIETNEEATKRQLKHQKFKKYNILKYKPKDTQKVTATLKADQTLPKQSYAKAVSAGLKRKSSFTNFTNQLSPSSKNNETRKSPSTENTSNQGISLEKKIQLLNPTTSKKPWGKPPSRNNSKKNKTKKKEAAKLNNSKTKSEF